MSQTVATHALLGRTLTREHLPRWPLALPFLGYPVAWFLGIGDTIWPISGLVCGALLLRCRDVRVPRGFGLWILFLAWMLASAIHLDSFGRLLGFGYRASLYIGATLLAVYAYNATRAVTVRYFCGILAAFLAMMTVAGLLAASFPLWSFHTPLSYVLPQSLQANELVGEMVVRRMTQFDPGAWEQVDPRPSAPFIYTNTWGNVYSLVLPLTLLYAWLTWRSTRSILVLSIAALSVVPAVLTSNRGMLVGIAVIVAWMAVQALRAGRIGELASGAVLALVAVAAWSVSPAADRLNERIDTGSSTEDRFRLYADTLRVTMESPLFGHGAPRPAETPWLPALGTQGQLWTVLFSHGFVGAALFLGWFGWTLVVAWRRIDRVSAVLGGVVAATVAETLFYGMMTGLAISLIASVLVHTRPDDRSRAAPGRPHRRSGLSAEPVNDDGSSPGTMNRVLTNNELGKKSTTNCAKT